MILSSVFPTAALSLANGKCGYNKARQDAPGGRICDDSRWHSQRGGDCYHRHRSASLAITVRDRPRVEFCHNHSYRRPRPPLTRQNAAGGCYHSDPHPKRPSMRPIPYDHTVTVGEGIRAKPAQWPHNRFRGCPAREPLRRAGDLGGRMRAVRVESGRHHCSPLRAVANPTNHHRQSPALPVFDGSSLGSRPQGQGGPPSVGGGQLAVGMTPAPASSASLSRYPDDLASTTAAPVRSRRGEVMT